MRNIDKMIRDSEPMQPNLSLLKEYKKLAINKQLLDGFTNSRSKLFGMLRFIFESKAKGTDISQYSEEFNLLIEIVDITYEVNISMLYY